MGNCVISSNFVHSNLTNGLFFFVLVHRLELVRGKCVSLSTDRKSMMIWLQEPDLIDQAIANHLFWSSSEGHSQKRLIVWRVYNVHNVHYVAFPDSHSVVVPCISQLKSDLIIINTHQIAFSLVRRSSDDKQVPTPTDNIKVHLILICKHTFLALLCLILVFTAIQTGNKRDLP